MTHKQHKMRATRFKLDKMLNKNNQTNEQKRKQCNCVLSSRPMILRKSFAFSLLMLAVALSIKAQEIRGIVKDSANSAPLAFVSISVKGNPTLSTMTDIDGQFILQGATFPCSIDLSYVGYAKASLSFTNPPKGKITIKLSASEFKLNEVNIIAGENPAHRIIRETWLRRDQNNHEKLPEYSCSTYNKLVLTGKKDSSFTAKTEQDQQDLHEADSLFALQHLFMIESSNKRYQRNGKVKEEVLGSRVSGLEQASIFMLALKFQPFSFYEPLINLSGIDYINPISRNSESIYFFSLEDTLFNGRDTTYLIHFHPRKGKTFKALEGVIYIDAPDYAISHVIADPIQEDAPTSMNIRQQYKKQANGLWFPEQIITSLVFNGVNMPGYKLVGESRTYVSNVDLNPNLPRSKFDEVELDVLDSKAKKDTMFWRDIRIEDLTDIEKNTYLVMDSLFKAENVERKLKAFEYLSQGFVPIRWFNLDITKIARYNTYEGFRLGAGGLTNDRLSKRFAFGGFLAYGFKDEALKYGAETQVYLHPKSELTLRLAWSNDVHESGGAQIRNFRKPQRAEVFRELNVGRMDMEEKTSASLGFRWLRYMHTTVFADQVHVSPRYDYSYKDLPQNTRFSWLETGASFVYSYKQSFYRNGNIKLPMSTPNPVFYLQIMHANDISHGGANTYSRVDFVAEHSITFRRIGKSLFQFNAGYIDGQIPYSRLFNIRSNYRKGSNFPVISTNTFGTYDMNAFVSDQYASFFFQHQIGPLFKIKTFKPDFSIFHNAMIGQLSDGNRVSQQLIDAVAPSKGLFEAGLAIDNLIKLSGGGYGVGALYRYGATTNKDWKKNIFVKFSVSLLF